MTLVEKANLCYTTEKSMNPINAPARASTADSARSISEALKRLAIPMALFTVSLVGMLGISSFTILPALTTVEVSGNKNTMDELSRYAAKLEADIATFEAGRTATLEPLHDSPYSALIQRKLLAPKLRSFLDSLAQVIARVEPTEGVVVIEHLRFEPANNVAVLRGDVRNVGPQSMTVLAQLIESLRDTPSVASVTTPQFTRKQDAELGSHSPFTVNITLQ